MGKMHTLKPDESINDHMKESIAMLNQLAESIGDDYYLSSTMIRGIKPDSVRFAIEHVCNSIEMLDELCDELEEDKDGIRQEYEEKVIQFFNRFMNADITDESNYRAGELARLVHQLDNRVGELDQELEKERERSNQLNEDCEHFRLLAISRNNELEKERKKSNQLEKHCKDLVHQLKEEHERYMKLREAKEQSPAYWKAKFERMQKKYSQLDKYCGELETEIDFLRSEDTDSVEVNDPANFCGNCKYFKTHPNDVGICDKHETKTIVDPDDASCPLFESNQVDRDKPDHPCCKACNRDDCDDCTLCPF